MPGNTFKGAVLELRLKDTVLVQGKVHVLEARSFDDFETTVSGVLRAPEKISPNAAPEDARKQVERLCRPAIKRLEEGVLREGGLTTELFQLLRDDVESACPRTGLPRRR
ncbi:hypothetical protein LTR10_000167 [Elasticomyces elasticus]|nr:hypothetical protein LTR10_000167 [Elasticomyces elasticus]KAK4980575.1 hypothetical protein LTR42_000883 [Elasticomyces elasticus]KAK5730234.1 hypothetical protein LTR15_000168 [Elasticomyces elasticus]